jgi:hypothetical protein
MCIETAAAKVSKANSERKKGKGKSEGGKEERREAGRKHRHADKKKSREDRKRDAWPWVERSSMSLPTAPFRSRAGRSCCHTERVTPADHSGQQKKGGGAAADDAQAQ